MTTQTTYGERIGAPSAGTIAGQMDNARVSTGICETASPGIGFGLAVSQGTLSDQGVVLGGTLAGFRGVSVKDIALEAASASVDHFLPPNSLSVLESGDIWVKPNAAVAANDAVYFVAATGLFSNSATTPSTALGPIKGARWKTAASANEPAILSLPTYSQKSG